MNAFFTKATKAIQDALAFDKEVSQVSNQAMPLNKAVLPYYYLGNLVFADNTSKLVNTVAMAFHERGYQTTGAVLLSINTNVKYIKAYRKGGFKGLLKEYGKNFLAVSSAYALAYVVQEAQKKDEVIV